MSRFFAFGCSYTKYAYATWADYVASNFDEYYNFGAAGSSNTYIMNRLVEVDSQLSFNEGDYVAVMLTGFGRFSYFPKPTKEEPHQRWMTNGDLYEYSRNTKDDRIESFIKKMYSENWAIYSSWIAAKTIKNILSSRGIKHSLLMAIDNSNYLDNDGSKWGREDAISNNAIAKTTEIYNLLDVKESVDQWMARHNFKRETYTKWEDINRYDGHPTQLMHLEFVKDNLPNFYTDAAVRLYNQVDAMFISSSQKEQGEQFLNNFHRKFDKSNTISVF